MIFFFQNPSLKKNFLFEGVKVRRNWLVKVNLFYKESKSEKKKERTMLFYFLFLFGGGGAERGGGGGKCIFFIKGSKSKIKKKQLGGGGGGRMGGRGIILVLLIYMYCGSRYLKKFDVQFYLKFLFHCTVCHLLNEEILIYCFVEWYRKYMYLNYSSGSSF